MADRPFMHVRLRRAMWSPARPFAAAAAAFLLFLGLAVGVIIDSRGAAAECLAANQWAWGSCGSSQGGGGGGSRNYAAAIGAANAAIGILGIMIEQAEAAQRAEQAAANEAARRRAAYCNSKYRQSYALNEQARQTVESDPEAAYRKFEAALTNLGDCGAGSDLAKLRNNLDSARASYATLTTPSASKNVFGGDAPQRPDFSAQRLRDHAKQDCAHLEEGTGGWQLCIRRGMARMIMNLDRDTREICFRESNEDLRIQCALNQYFAGYYGKDRNQVRESSLCYFDEHGKACNGRRIAVTSPSATPPAGRVDSRSTQDKEDRDSLRKRIDAMPSNIPQSEIDRQREEAFADAKSYANSLPPDSPERKEVERVIAEQQAKWDAERGIAAQPKQASADPKDAPKGDDAKKDEPYEYGIEANRRRGAKAKEESNAAILDHTPPSYKGREQLDMRNPGAGVPDRGSFGNDFGGDDISGGHVPSRR